MCSLMSDSTNSITKFIDPVGIFLEKRMYKMMIPARKTVYNEIKKREKLCRLFS